MSTDFIFPAANCLEHFCSPMNFYVAQLLDGKKEANMICSCAVERVKEKIFLANVFNLSLTELSAAQDVGKAMIMQ